MHRIDIDRLPRHIAIIMDGNGRWAKQHTLKRIIGHRKGAETVRTTVRVCREIGIEYLTLYAFSVENWCRPAGEVNALMLLLERYIRSELNELIDNDIKLNLIGNINSLPDTTQKTLLEAIQKTSNNKRMILTLALSYGGRDEIIETTKKILRAYETGDITIDDITKDIFSRFLYTSGMPDPDLLIRTSGEYRISNFLLWQLAYAELYFTDVLWPEFSRQDIIEAIADYQKRERRFGLISD